MNTNVYLKKVYTVAFRLTGDEKTACELAAQAILKLTGETGKNNKISEYMFKAAALEVCRLFLEKYDTYYNEFNFDIHISDSKNIFHEVQEAVLNLKPISRIIIIWKDSLGFQLSDLIIITDTCKKELNDELSYARMRVKELIGDGSQWQSN